MNNITTNQQPIDNQIKQLITKQINNKITTITQLNQGLSGALVYKVCCPNKNYVLKIINKDTQQLILNKFAENQQALLKMSESGIIPQIHYTDLSKGIILIDYINPTPYSLNNSEHQEALVKLLHTLHNIKDCGNLQKCSLDGYLSYANDALTKIVAVQQLPEFVNKLQKLIDSIKNDLESSWNYQLCHLDINPSNLVYDGNKFYLLDLDSIHLCDPIIDIVTVMNFFCHSPQLKQTFTQMYFAESEVNQNLAKRLFFMSQINNYWYGLAFLKVAINDTKLNLAEVKINDLSTPSDFWKKLSQGQENLSTSLSQSRLGLCMLKYAYSKLSLELQIFSYPK